MTEAELDQHIACCARLMEAAMEKGDRAEAVAWQQAMYAAIAGRTPEHRQRIEAEIQARIERDPCYFCAMGEADRARLARGEVPC